MNTKKKRLLILAYLFAMPNVVEAEINDFVPPTAALVSLAEQSQTRTLNAAEVQAVMANETTGIVYLKALLASQASGSPYVLPPLSPSGCLTAPLYELLSAASDGTSTNQEVEAIAARHKLQAYWAYLLAYGTEHPAINSAISPKLEYLRRGALKTYISARATEPEGIGAIVDHYFKRLWNSEDLIVARLIELGAPARDEMVARLESTPIPSISDKLEKLKYRSLLSPTIFLLAAAKDPRLSPEGILTQERVAFLTSNEKFYIDRVMGSSAERDIRMSWAMRVHWHACVNTPRLK